MAGMVKRGEHWHIRMRVPRRYSAIEPRGEIHRSLRTEEQREAERRLPAAEAAILAELDARLTMRGGSAPEVFAAAVALAATRGVAYRSVEKLAVGPLDEILSRLDVLKPADDRSTAKALLGGVEAPRLLLSRLVKEVEKISEHENRFKSEDQLRKWRHPRERAVKNLIAALKEDKPVLEVGKEEALTHKLWWAARVANEGLSVDTANKDFANLSGMLKRYFESLKMIDPPRPYERVALSDRHAKKKRKLEIPADWIRDKWFAVGALDGLNDEARDILLVSIETGCRQSEVQDLPPRAIVLNAPIPYISVALESGEDGEDRREVKNMASERHVPLVGVALAAAKRHPNGFPRYRGTSNYSATVNKYLRENGLMPSPAHTIGGTRHAWETRLKDAKVELDDRGWMMGHSVKQLRNRELYGDDMPLPKKLEYANLVVLPVPEHLA